MSPTTRYDVVVVGLGAMGSAALYQLARRGIRVLGIDRSSPPHPWGSTHGDTRISRVAIGEGLEYVPLVRRSHEIWREIEEHSGESLLVQCGVAVIAPAYNQTMHGNDSFLATTIEAAEAFGIDHRVLGAAEIAELYPQFELSGQEEGYFEPGGGYVRPEACVRAQLMLARRHGAALRLDEVVTGFTDHGGSVTVRTATGTVECGRLVVCAGPWIGELVPDLAAYCRVYRQVLYWFDLAERDRYAAFRDMPVYIWWSSQDRDDMIYGFPMVDGPDGGAKLAGEQYVVATEPSTVRREVGDAEIGEMFESTVRGRIPALGPRSVKAVSCLYTVTPDSRFVIDRHPVHANVVVASPCSGHGFKHSAAIGEVLAELATTGSSTIDVGSFGYPHG